MTLKFISGGKIFFLLRQEDDRCAGTRIGLCQHCFYCVRFLFPPEVEKCYEPKIYIWGEIFFLLQQEDDCCTGTRIGLSHYCFYCVRFLFPPEVEKSYEPKIYIWGEIFFFIAAGGRSLYRDSHWIESLLFLLRSVSVPARG
jgi:hypothetical protein